MLYLQQYSGYKVCTPAHFTQKTPEKSSRGVQRCVGDWLLFACYFGNSINDPVSEHHREVDQGACRGFGVAILS